MNNEGYKYLAGAVVEAVIFDYERTSDAYKKDALLKWFDTRYGSGLCEMVGIDPEYIKNKLEVMHYEKTYRRYDRKGVKKVYRKTY